MRIAQRSHRRDEHGAVVLIVLLCVLAIFTVVAIVFDIGASLVIKRQVVAAADSSSLAAAQSCATGKSGEAQAQADTYANDNRPGVTGGIESANCVTGTGYVTTAYSSDAHYNVAPFVGLGDQGSVGARATSIWGPAGTVEHAVPIMLDSRWLNGNCKIPDASIGTECAFWYDNSNTTDGSQNNWGFMNLDQWDVSSGAHCSNAGANDRGTWIINGYPDLLSLNYPDPTYVCSDSGHAAGNWLNDLESTIGQTRAFPVVDPDNQIPPLPGAADKYDVIGWTFLQIEDVLKGNDPAAVGSTSTYPCTGTWTATKGDTKTLDSLGCFTTSPSTVGTPTLTGKLTSAPTPSPSPTGNGNGGNGNGNGNGGGNQTVTFQQGVDYSYDASTRTLTWLNPSSANVTIKFDWSVTSGGACPGHAPNPNAVCLVTKWMGTQIGGQDPCNGLPPDQCGNVPDFGASAIRLFK